VMEYISQTWPGTWEYIINWLNELIYLPKDQECSYKRSKKYFVDTKLVDVTLDQLPGHRSSQPNIPGPMPRPKNTQLTGVFELHPHALFPPLATDTLHPR
jgi:hypothetical protein